MILTIPTGNEPYADQRTDLDGVTYVFRWAYSGREDRWSFDLTLADGTPVVMGCRIVCSIPLLRRYHYRAACPPGELVCVAYSDDDSPPGLDDLVPGGRCALLYLTAT